MESVRCEILVVGAGPAGTSAAWAAAGMGRDVWVVDRRSAVGLPVRCGEYVPAPFLGEVDLDRGAIVQAVRGMRTILPGGEVVARRWPGHVIRRDALDRALARAAEGSGARILLSVQALRLEHDEVVVRRRGQGTETRFIPRVVIGADGPRSTVGRWIGSGNPALLQAVQWRMPLASPMEDCEVYFHRDLFGGYGWLFPAGDEANVGVGRKPRGIEDEPVGRLLARLVSRLVESGRVGGDPLRTTGGWIPAGPVRRVTRGNVLLVGDAAGHAHPITGAGIAQAVIGGRIAGTWAARAVETGDLGLLSGYEKEWEELFGEVQDRAARRRAFLEQNWDDLEKALRRAWIACPGYYDDDEADPGPPG